jgi:hypothetical protein
LVGLKKIEGGSTMPAEKFIEIKERIKFLMGEKKYLPQKTIDISEEI